MAAATSKIEVFLNPEDRTRLDRLIQVLKDQQLSNVEPSTVTEVHPVEDPFPAPAAEAEPAKVEPAQPECTADDLRRKMSGLLSRGGDVRAQAMEALHKYGEKISKIAESDYAALMADLEAIG